MKIPTNEELVENYQELFLALTSKERDVLRVCLSKPVVQYSDFNALIQPGTPASNLVNVNMMNLRRKLKKLRSPLKIMTVRGYGFALQK